MSSVLHSSPFAATIAAPIISAISFLVTVSPVFDADAVSADFLLSRASYSRSLSRNIASSMCSVVPPPDPDVSLSPTVNGVFKLVAPGLYGFTSCLPGLGDAVFVAPTSGAGSDAGALVSMILSYAGEAGPVTFA